MEKILLLSCSAKKDESPGLLPAVQRYTGPIYQSFKKFAKNNPSVLKGLELWILSAEFGLIPAMEKIPYYEHKMSEADSLKLAPQVIETWGTILPRLAWFGNICVCMSQLYMSTFQGHLYDYKGDVTVTVCDGDMFEKPRQLIQWLESIK